MGLSWLIGVSGVSAACPVSPGPQEPFQFRKPLDLLGLTNAPGPRCAKESAQSLLFKPTLSFRANKTPLR